MIIHLTFFQNISINFYLFWCDNFINHTIFYLTALVCGHIFLVLLIMSVNWLVINIMAPYEAETVRQNDLDIFCFICGEHIFIQYRKIITDSAMSINYFIPKLCCVWFNGKRSALKFRKPIIWRINVIFARVTNINTNRNNIRRCFLLNDPFHTLVSASTIEIIDLF